MTDPPFFDNVHYSQLADFFYYWLNQALEFSSALTTRRASEVQDTDPAHCTAKLGAVFAECSRVLSDAGLCIFTYHHARHEGWTCVHRAIRQAGFFCTRAYPIKAEMSVSVPLQQVRSPIQLDLILVCRKAQGQGSERHRAAIDTAREQIGRLKSAGITVSLSDAKVILMGCFLCEIHTMRNICQEERYLGELSGVSIAMSIG